MSDGTRELPHWGGVRSVALLGLIPAVLAVALLALGPRWIVVAGQSLVDRWVLGHAATDGLIARLGGVQDAGNLLLFVPVALLVAVAVPVRWLGAAFVLCAPLPLLVEATQHWIPGRVPDLSDVALNTAGLVLAFLGVVILRAIGMAKSARLSRRTTALKPPPRCAGTPARCR